MQKNSQDPNIQILIDQKRANDAECDEIVKLAQAKRDNSNKAIDKRIKEMGREPSKQEIPIIARFLAGENEADISENTGMKQQKVNYVINKLVPSIASMFRIREAEETIRHESLYEKHEGEGAIFIDKNLENPKD